MMDLRNNDLRTKASQSVAETVTTKLSEEQLSSVSGGKHVITKASPVLMKACATGEHLREATITH